MRICTTGSDATDETGMARSAQNCLPVWLEETQYFLGENCHILLLTAPRQQHHLPTIGNNGKFPRGDDLGQYIVAARSAAYGVPQSFVIIVETSYAPLARPQREQTITGVSMGTYMNMIRESRLSHTQFEQILTSQSPCMIFQRVPQNRTRTDRRPNCMKDYAT